MAAKARKKAKKNDILSQEGSQMAMAETVGENYGKELYDLQQLLEIARSLCSTLDYSKLVESILYTCMGQMRVLGAGIFVLDNVETDNYILGTNYIGMDLDSEIEYAIPQNHPVIEVLNEKEKAFFIDDIKKALPNESLEEIYSLKPSLILPLFQRNSINGILLLSERMDLGGGTAYSDYEIKQMLRIASLASIAINNAVLFERSSTDMMTHLKMKYYFFNVLGEKLELALSQNVPVAVIMFDIDHFKSFNDTYGHACGDYVLISVSKIIRANVRHQDMASRYGGEEFTVMLPNTLKEDAMAVAERIREIIGETDFVYEGQHMHVTISGGVSVYDKDLNPVSDTKKLVEQADMALYVSKKNGRNRITFADSEIIASTLTNCA